MCDRVLDRLLAALSFKLVKALLGNRRAISSQALAFCGPPFKHLFRAIYPKRMTCVIQDCRGASIYEPSHSLSQRCGDLCNLRMGPSSCMVAPIRNIGSPLSQKLGRIAPSKNRSFWGHSLLAVCDRNCFRGSTSISIAILPRTLLCTA